MAKQNTVELDLPVKLTIDEIVETSERLVDLLIERREADSEYREFTSDHRQRIKRLDGDIARMSTLVKSVPSNAGRSRTQREDEIVEKSERLADLLIERREVDSEYREITGDYRQRIKRLDGDIARMSTLVKSGEEIRPIECWEEPDYDQGVVEVFRRDTGSLVHVREMHDGDRQLGIA
jgi:hypothetical protein